jgi:hypothetical protein
MTNRMSRTAIESIPGRRLAYLTRWGLAGLEPATERFMSCFPVVQGVLPSATLAAQVACVVRLVVLCHVRLPVVE